MPSEFLVNTYAGQWQDDPDVTRLADGSIVVVWDSFYFEGDDRFYYIAAQRYSADGRKLGGEQLLDGDLGGQSTKPAITALADGGYAVAWQTAQGSSISDQTDVYARTFDADGTARGASVRVHAANAQDQDRADIVATANGGFTVTWTSYGGSKIDTWEDVFLRTFDADGKPVGGVKQVDTFTEQDQLNSHMTMLSDGNVLVTWESKHGGNPYPSGQADGVRARIYSQTGAALTAEFTVVGENDGFGEDDIGVAALKDGRFVVSWFESSVDADNNVFFEVRARLFANDGTPAGQSILVRIDDNRLPYHTRVEALDGGGFVVAWDQFDGSTGQLQEVYARVYDDVGRAVSGIFRVNEPSGASDQELPELQALDGGGFMAVYQSEFADGDDKAIAGRICGQGSYRADADAMLWAGTWHALGGNDAVVGTNRADRIYGDGGDDVLAGVRGADRLTGGPGADTFVYFEAADSTARVRDTIVAFDGARDRIDLSRVDATFHWIGAGAFSGAAGELRFAGGLLSADFDGNRVADFVVKVTGDAVTPAELIL